ncbi:MAG: ribonucleoside diphosphate reductase large subunit [Edafosvirus sp.]|uniref:Ribonucleoside-diphosphate reductase n=1 Tax=Edafosvirus sp. TaxID=2487765 RepID=A0A3G4ZU58_9VIRU|nr:MAG: ribonucleoside diphosphate reductase large subunit [Edafosvirus sp.]
MEKLPKNKNILLSYQMEVIKRDGRHEKISFDKITQRLDVLCWGLNRVWVDPIKIAMEVIKNIKNKITTEELDYLAADICATQISKHPDFNKLAARISVSNLHKTTDPNYANVISKLYHNTDIEGNHHPLVSKELFEIVIENKEKIQKEINYDRDYYFDYFGIRTLERSYLLRTRDINKKKYYEEEKEGRIIERPQHLFMRVALGIHGNDLDKVFETYHYTSQLYFTHATPTLFNAGTPRPQNSSCYLLGMADSITGIFKTIGDIAQISKWAGGIGVHLTGIRAKNSVIRGTNGKSDGIIPLCLVLNKVGRYVNQGGKRNGSIAVYLEPYHADIFEFCELRKNTKDEDTKARDLFLALWIPDLFMKRVKENGKWSLMCPDQCPGLNTTYGEEFEQLYEKYEREGKYKRQVNAIDLWYHILDAQIETGVPYMAYKDSINHKSNQKNYGMIRSSNLCVDGDTMILTDDGHKPIKKLQNKNVNIWNGRQWSKVVVKKTGENQNLVKVNMSNGVELNCTPQHKFYIQGDYQVAEPIIKEAQQLTKGDKIIKWELPDTISFKNNEEFKYPYTHGFFCGDGTTYDNYSKTVKYPKLYLYGEKKKLLDHIEKQSYTINDSCDRYDVILLKDIREKFAVPMHSTIKTRLRWLEGYADADGTIARNGTNESLHIGSIEKDFLLKVKLLLQTLGVDSKITKSHNEGYRKLPDSNKELKDYYCQASWRLLIDSNALYHLGTIGFAPKRLKFKIRKPQRKASQFVTIQSVKKGPQNVDTYCFTEEKRHMGVFNGILTGQCAEIMEYSDEKEYAVCTLASICLPKYIEMVNGKPQFNFAKLMKIAKIATYNLNKVIDVNYYPTPETKLSNFKHRPIGVGVQGLADVFNHFKCSFDSAEAKILNKKIFETIYFGCLQASNELAKKYGPYETFKGSPFSKGQLQFHLWGLKEEELLMNYDWKTLINDIMEYGTMNSLLTALMPTASTSQIMGNNESFEPHTSNLYVRSTLAGNFLVVNEQLVKDLIEANLWDEDMRKEIIIDNGSIQNIPRISTYLKNIYKTAFEIKQKDILIQAADRGPFVDQSQSMNLFSNEPDTDKLSSAHFYGWSSGLKTGMYYLRSQPAVNPIKFGIDAEDIMRIKKKKLNADVPVPIPIEMDQAQDKNNKRKRDDEISHTVPEGSNETKKQKMNDQEKAEQCRLIRSQNNGVCVSCSS